MCTQRCPLPWRAGKGYIINKRALNQHQILYIMHVCVCACVWAVCSVAHSCLTLCDLMNYRPLGSSVHEISLARIVERVAMPSSRGSSQPKDRTRASCISSMGRQVLYHRATWEAQSGSSNSSQFLTISIVQSSLISELTQSHNFNYLFSAYDSRV